MGVIDFRSVGDSTEHTCLLENFRLINRLPSPCAMMNHCVVVGCTNYVGKKPRLRFYRFASEREPDRRRRWTAVVRWANWSPGKHGCICREHFVTGLCTVRNKMHSGMREKVTETWFYFAFMSGHIKVNPIVSQAILTMFPACFLQSTSRPREGRIRGIRGIIDSSRGGMSGHYKTQ